TIPLPNSCLGTGNRRKPNPVGRPFFPAFDRGISYFRQLGNHEVGRTLTLKSPFRPLFTIGFPVLTAQEMRNWEASSWEAGLNPQDVIQRAGSLIAKAILKRTRPNDRVLLVAGPGNNGNDARACALHLTDRDTLLIDVTDPELGLRQLHQALDLPFSLLLDGVFGIGLNRNLEGPWRQIIETLNMFRCQRIALDCPSGLDADTGRARGASFEADETWTLGAQRQDSSPKSPPFYGSNQGLFRHWTDRSTCGQQPSALDGRD
ncbi:MAG: hypothetical protein EXS25_11810, partial [Pedosphaera sp.]|nr:hypothetical protein [Pedosphaera sp.]